MTKRCLVTGATGFIGSHLVDALLEQGWDVRCLVRSPARARTLSVLPVEVCAGDLMDATSLVSAVQGVSHVFHVAGLTRAVRLSDYYAVNTRATDRLLRACAEHAKGIERVVFVSSLAAAGPSPMGAPKSERSPDAPISAYGRSKLRAELLVRAWGARLPFVVIRPPIAYGPRDGDTLLLFRLIRRGLRPVLPTLRRLSLVHVQDLVQGLLLAASRPEAEGKTYYVSGHDRDLAEIFDIIATALATKPRAVNVPLAALDFAAWAAEGWARMLGSPATLDRSKAAEAHQAFWLCSSEKITRELGYLARYTPEEGLEQTARWYRAAGWL